MKSAGTSDACRNCHGRGTISQYSRELQRRTRVTCGRCNGSGNEPSESIRDIRKRLNG